jgi:DhnA family fructose-bisphosphate aldolase class Ia
MNGKEFRLARFFGSEDKLVVAALDHGAFHGPVKGLEDPRKACANLVNADAVLMAAGMIPHVNDLFTGPDAPWLITRLAWNSTYCFQWKYNESRHQPLMTVSQAAAKGVDVVLASLSIHTGSEEVDARNAGLFSGFVQQAAELGIPIIGEFFPARTEEMSPEELHDIIKIGCRVAAELGADLIKTFYTGPKFKEIVASTPVPILVLGAEKTPTERDALNLALKAVQSGARGIVFGRNIVQSRNPAGFIDAVREVMNKRLSIASALKRYKLGV